jgi:hypothetical protein
MTHTNEIADPETATTYYKCKLLSIEAWRDPEGGWDWNNISTIEGGIYIAEDSELLSSSRKLLKYFRDNLCVLSDKSKGRVFVDFGHDLMDGVLLVVHHKGTGEPLFALSSVHG